MRTDGVAFRICFREAQDALREGFAVHGNVGGMPLENDPESTAAWDAWMGRHDVPGLAVRGRGLARGFGAGVWVLWVEDGRRSDQPIDWHNIRSVKWIKCLRGGPGGLVQPQTWDDDPRSARFGQPRLYNVSFARGGKAGLFHWHRVIVWQGLEVDEQDLADRQGWGESVLDQVWTALSRFGASHQYALAALLKLSQGVFSSQYLANALEAGRVDEAAKRLEDVSLGMGVYGEIGIGKDETYQIVGRPISGTDALLEKMIEILVMYTDMPEIVLRGKRPGGLSTSADGEFRGWYDFVASLQPTHYSPPLLRLVDIASRSLDGPTHGLPVLDASIHWPQLWQLTEAEKLGNRKLAADSRAVDISAGVVTTAEARSDPELDEWYVLGELQPPPEDQVLAEGEAAPQDLDVLPAGEQLMSIREAADILGYRSTGAARAFASQHGALFKIGSRYKVARSLLLAGLRAAQVEQAPASVEPVAPGAPAADVP
jgi:phage-related protein (TIGR01555 family)